MADIQPIKRTTELAPLSREHHNGLLAVWKIRQGIRKGIAIQRIVSFCNAFFETELKCHTEKEEQLLPKVLPAGHPMLQRMFAEHKLIHQLFQELSNHISYQELEQLAGALNDHIRFEERQLFNEVEKLAAPEDLQIIAKQLNEENPCTVWEDEYWLHK